MRIIYHGYEENPVKARHRKLLNRAAFVSTVLAYAWVATFVVLAQRELTWTLPMMVAVAVLFFKSLKADEYKAEENPPPCRRADYE